MSAVHILQCLLLKALRIASLSTTLNVPFEKTDANMSHAAAIVMFHKTEVITSSFVGDGGRKSKCFQTVSFPSGVCQTSTHGISPQAQTTLIKKTSSKIASSTETVMKSN